jgi:SSS family solute:Na+ symporter
MNAKGALSALIVGSVLGLFRLAVDTPLKFSDDFSYEEGSLFWFVGNIFFQYYSILILIVCIAVMYIVSYASEEPDYAKISGLTYGTVTDENRTASRASWNKWDVIASAVAVGAILAAYLYFTG